ncbi:MAG: hypothetical protein ACLTX3_07085 [Lachnospiraceae bacterium]
MLDSVADGVAVYMTQHQSATYSEVAKQADYIKGLLVDKTGIDIIDVSIDQKEFEDSKIKVTLSAGQWYLPSLASIQWDQNETKYQIQKQQLHNLPLVLLERVVLHKDRLLLPLPCNGLEILMYGVGIP